jgi:hypothetical protein
MKYIESTEDVIRILQQLKPSSSVGRVLNVEKAIKEEGAIGSSLRKVFHDIRYNKEVEQTRKDIEIFIEQKIGRTEKGNFQRVLKALRGAPLVITRATPPLEFDLNLRKVKIELLKNEFGQIALVDFRTGNPNISPSVLMNPSGSIGHEFLMAAYQFPYMFWIAGDQEAVRSICINPHPSNSQAAYKILLQAGCQNENKNYEMAVETYLQDKKN